MNVKYIICGIYMDRVGQFRRHHIMMKQYLGED